MLYVSTKNPKDVFTAHHALHEATAPDGGVYVPYHLPVFSQDDLVALKQNAPCEVIAQILNLFFGSHLSGWDVECEIGKNPFRLETMQHKFLVAECWKNPGFSSQYLLKNIYGLMTGTKNSTQEPNGWARVAIKLALLFAILSQTNNTLHKLDIAVTGDDFSDLAAIAYGKAMGLPINLTVCSCDNDNMFWDLVNRGECSCSGTTPTFLECYLYITIGREITARFSDALQNRKVFRLDEEEPVSLADEVFVAVVSKSRVDSVITNMYRTNAYTFDTEAALAYGALQDYRSSTGTSRDTLLFSKKRPAPVEG